jgi:hypothetical protein
MFADVALRVNSLSYVCVVKTVAVTAWVESSSLTTSIFWCDGIVKTFQFLNIDVVSIVVTV